VNTFDRRSFLRIAGAAAGTVAAYTWLPGIVLSEKTGEAVFAASASLQPGFVAPAIVKPGSAIPLTKTPVGRFEMTSAWLETQDGRPGLISKEAPDPGMYDLVVEVSRGGRSRLERQPNAVKVVGDFKSDFSFGLISDVHFGDPRLTSRVPDFSVAETVVKEIDILNEAGVEFCICCGDLCFIPPKTKDEIMEYADVFSRRAKFPVFTVPGNHDGYSSGTPGRISFDTFKYWDNSFGPMNFPASYGNISIIGINTFDKAPADRNLYGGLGEDVDTGAMGGSQLEWLDAALSAASDTGGTTILFGHHNPTNTVKDVNGPFSIVPFSETGRRELLGLIEKHAPEYFFAGHVHGIHEETYAATKIHTVPTAACLPAEGHPVGIQIASVSNGKISSIETVEMLRL